jgi:hypothetical protein
MTAELAQASPIGKKLIASVSSSSLLYLRFFSHLFSHTESGAAQFSFHACRIPSSRKIQQRIVLAALY